LTFALGEELSENNRVWKYVHKVAELLPTNSLQSATRESPVTPEQFTDLLERIAVRMGGHTIPVIHGPAWHNFMGLLRQVKPYECGIGPMPSEGNSPYVGEKP
jgi:hypothetical protein